MLSHRETGFWIVEFVAKCINISGLQNLMITVDVSQTEVIRSVTPMTEAETRAAVADINARIDSLRQKLAELHLRKGWQALGYRSWKEFSETEFKRDRRNSYYLVEAAEVESNLIEAGVEPRKIFHTPDSQLRVIGGVPKGLQLKAFQQLLKFQKEDGRVTVKEAEAATAAVYPNAEWARVEALSKPVIEGGLSKIPMGKGADTVYQYWEDKKKPVPKRMKEVLRQGIEEHIDREREKEEDQPASSLSNSIDPAERKLMEIVDFLNSYEPEQLAEALTRLMDEHYGMAILLRFVPHLDKKKEVASNSLKEMKVENNDIEKLSDSLFALCQHLDDVF